MTGRFGNAIDNFLIIMVAVAIVLLLVVMLGSRQSPFRQKLSKLLVQNPNAADRRQPLEFNREYYITERDLCVNQIVERIRHAL